MGHECSECTFVASREAIFVDKKTRERVRNKPVYVGTFTLPNWKGHLKFYVYLCPCGAHVVDYAHGFTNGGYLFFHCDVCDGITQIEDEEIYKDSKIQKPSLWLMFLGAIRARVNRFGTEDLPKV